MLHLEHCVVWWCNSVTSGSRTEQLAMFFVRVVVEKKTEEYFDRSYEKQRSVT
jgi:hypothetical protein